MRAHGFGHRLVCAQAGREVTVIEVAEEYLNKGLGSLKKQLDKMVEKGKLSADDRWHDRSTSQVTKLDDAARRHHHRSNNRKHG